MKTNIISDDLPLTKFKTTVPRFLIAVALVCFALLPGAQAVTPAPDGGYPGGNTAEGQNALFSLTSGTYNTAVGLFSLRSNTGGSFNTAIGAGTLLLNTADQNTAIGVGALLSNTSGGSNTATGVNALVSNTIAYYNTAMGYSALSSNTTGNSNTANGGRALFSNSTGSENTATGYQALLNNTTGDGNTANGISALYSNSTGHANTANGAGALSNNTADQNTATGAAALLSNTTGGSNTANGFQALRNNNTGHYNTAIGDSALLSNDGYANTAIGYSALSSNTDGFVNTAIGDHALFSNTTGDANTALGYAAGSGVTTADNVICIGANVGGANVSNSCYIGNIYGTFNTAQSATVFIDPDGRLGTGPSARRFKKDIADMGAASEVLLSMRPVTFHFKTQDTDKADREISQFGLIAEEVAEVNPDLILRDKEGEIYSVRYDAVNAMLLNEFLKEHRKNEEQEKTIAELKSGMMALATTVKEQAAQIQKVSAQIELSKSARTVVVNTP